MLSELIILSIALQKISELSGFGQNKFIFDIIQLTWFRDRNHLGVHFYERFKPLSQVTLALIFTVVYLHSTVTGCLAHL